MNLQIFLTKIPPYPKRLHNYQYRDADFLIVRTMSHASDIAAIDHTRVLAAELSSPVCYVERRRLFKLYTPTTLARYDSMSDTIFQIETE